MKNYFLPLILIIVASPMFAQNDTSKIQKTFPDSIIYICPMHPEIISGKPGKCPKCGMDLVQKDPSSPEHKMNGMMSTMHGMVGMNHKHNGEKKDKKKLMKGMGMAMGAMMVVVLTAMMIIK